MIKLNSILFVLFIIISFNVKQNDSINLKCLACKTAVEAFKFVYERNQTSETILNFANYLCKTFTHYQPLICKGMTSQFKGQFLYVVEKLLINPSQLCGVIMSDCGDPYNPFNSNWTIKLPPKINISNNNDNNNAITNDIKNDKLNLRVLQLSDIHFDTNYQPGSESACSYPICCQKASTKTKVKKPAGYWGTIASCDIPYWTIENMIQHISENEKNLDYILLSGDYMSHNDWGYTRRDHITTINNLTLLINKYFPTTPVFWAIGNHEGVPVNSFAPHFIPKKFRPQWLYRTIYECGKKWLNKKNEKQIVYRGSYSIKLLPKLKLITVNTGYCETTNFFLYLNQTDPDDTLTWMVKELYESEKRSEYVHILAHIPPGDGECLEGWAKNYYRIIQRFSDTIKAQFFGHIHWDSFSMFYEDMNNPYSKPINVLYASPSVTTFEGLNPAYRIYNIQGDYHNSKHEIIDFETYFFNLTKSDEKTLPKWELLYTAKNEYNMPDLSPQSWQNLAEKIRTNITIFDKFVKNYVRHDDYSCDLKCRKEMLCSIRSSHHNSTSLCHDVTVTADPLSSIIKQRNKKMTKKGIIDSIKSTIWDNISEWITESG